MMTNEEEAKITTKEPVPVNPDPTIGRVIYKKEIPEDD
jgi:hypothetical protein